MDIETEVLIAGGGMAGPALAAALAGAGVAAALADRGLHRAPSVPDLIIAATAASMKGRPGQGRG